MQEWEYNLWHSGGLSFEHSGGSTNIHVIWEKQDTWKKVLELGREGWEMVNAFTTTGNSGETENIVFIFKRPKG